MSTLNDIFKEVYGTTPEEYLRALYPYYLTKNGKRQLKSAPHTVVLWRKRFYFKTNRWDTWETVKSKPGAVICTPLLAKMFT